jgi:hypothetical protein
MSIPEQAGNLAGKVVEGLKTNPSCLAALAVVALYGLLQYFESENQNQRMMDRTKEVGDLLRQCLIDAQTTRGIGDLPPPDLSTPKGDRP